MEILFLIFLFLSVYSYLIYPCVLFLLSLIRQNPWKKENILPVVSIIVSVHNEQEIIAEKISNTLELEYPQDSLEIIISSDGSTDGTEQIVSEFNDPHIVLLSFQRVGKTACLNKAVPAAKGNIVVFTDANSMFPPDLLSKMTRNFADADVGLVTGWTKYRSKEGGEDTTGIYARLEKWTKEKESMISSCVGADGAVFAIRRNLYQPLEDRDINDFQIPLHVIGQGKRVVLDRDVFCFEETSEEMDKAFRRQVRITTRTFSALRRNLEFLKLKYGFFSFFLLSHKTLRLTAPLFVLCAFILNLFVLNQSIFYFCTLIGQIFFLVLGLLGILKILNGRISSICKFFVITLIAQLFGFVRMLFGIEDNVWKPQR